MTSCRASLCAWNADGEPIGSWDSPLPDDADNHVDHLLHLAGVIDEHAALLAGADDVRMVLTVERGPVGAAAAVTVPAEVIAALAGVGGYLWIDAYQNTDEG